MNPTKGEFVCAPQEPQGQYVQKRKESQPARGPMPVRPTNPLSHLVGRRLVDNKISLLSLRTSQEKGKSVLQPKNITEEEDYSMLDMRPPTPTKESGRRNRRSNVHRFRLGSGAQIMT